MNRKLIRPNLADVKPKEREQRSVDGRNGAENTGAPRRNTQMRTAPASAQPSSGDSGVVEMIDDGASGGAAKTGSRRNAPPTETNAKVYYYKKQIDSHTRMIVVLQDNEEIEGTIEWYDRGALKINRKTAPNIMLLEHNIKYMYKVED